MLNSFSFSLFLSFEKQIGIQKKYYVTCLSHYLFVRGFLFIQVTKVRGRKIKTLDMYNER